MPDFSAPAADHHRAIIRGQLIHSFLGLQQGRANDSDVSTNNYLPFFFNPGVPSFSLSLSLSLSLSHSLLYFPCLVYSSFTEPIFTPLAQRAYSNTELQLGVSLPTPAALHSAHTVHPVSEAICSSAGMNHAPICFLFVVMWPCVT